MSYEAPHMNTMPQQEVKLTTEEEAFLKNCVNSRFWTRSIPAAIASSSMWWYLQVKLRGKPSATVGCIVAGFCGALTARLLSYSGCIFAMADKYPNGTLATFLRQKQGIRDFDHTGPSGNFYQQQQVPESSTSAAQGVHQAPSFLDLDTTIPDQKGLSESDLLHDDAISKSPSLNQSYEDLRRKNREQFKQHAGQPRISSMDPTPGSPLSAPSTTYYDPPITSTYVDTPMTGSVYMNSSPSTFPDPAAQDTVDESKKPKRKKLNKYGDEIEE